MLMHHEKSVSENLQNFTYCIGITLQFREFMLIQSFHRKSCYKAVWGPLKIIYSVQCYSTFFTLCMQ